MDSAFFWIFVAVAIGAWILINAREAKALQKAKQDYHDSLANLSRDPTNAALRKTTLSLGRAYSDLTRKRKGVTLFDEVALMNDIGAACGGSPVSSGPPAAALPVAPP